jgi:hypothetical protein
MSEESIADTSSVLYDAGEKAGAMVASIWNATDDGKISGAEWWTIAKKCAGVLAGAYSDSAELAEKISDGFDDQETLDFTTGFAAGFDITSDSTEVKVEALSGYALKAVGYVYILLDKKFFSKEDEADTDAESAE